MSGSFVFQLLSCSIAHLLYFERFYRSKWARRDSNPHEVLPQGILSPQRLPFRHSPTCCLLSLTPIPSLAIDHWADLHPL